LLVDFDGLAAGVPTTIATDAMRQFGFRASRARATRRGTEFPCSGTTAAGLWLGSLFLWDGHRWPQGVSPTCWNRAERTWRRRGAVNLTQVNDGRRRRWVVSDTSTRVQDVTW